MTLHGCPCAPNGQQGRSWWPYEPGDWTNMTWHVALGVTFGMLLALSNAILPNQWFWTKAIQIQFRFLCSCLGTCWDGTHPESQMGGFLVKLLVPPSLNQVTRWADAFPDGWLKCGRRTSCIKESPSQIKVELVELQKPRNDHKFVVRHFVPCWVQKLYLKIPSKALRWSIASWTIQNFFLSWGPWTIKCCKI